MPELIFKPVETRRERKQFLHLPWKLYHGDANWIPPLRLNQKELVGYKRHPFHEDADVQTFLAWRGNEVCGRIAAIVNHVHNRRFKERRGFFWFFVSINHQQVASGLFDNAKAWLAERDIQSMRGPMNPSFNYEIGLLVDGFDSPPTFMMTYNPPFYGQLIEEYGFRKEQDLYAYWGHVDMLETLDEKIAFVIEDSGPEDRELRRWQSAPLRGRALACALGSRILERLGGQIDVLRDADRTRVVLAVPTVQKPDPSRGTPLAGC